MRSASLLALLAVTVALADGPGDNIPDNVRAVPPKGNPIPAADLADIKMGLAELQQLVRDLGTHELLPDVRIFEKAVRWAVEHDENFDPKPGKDGKQPPAAVAVKKALATGLARAKDMKAGKTPWTTATGAVLRGYKSKIDGDVQPYWLIVPADYKFDGKEKHRLDFWWHGRFESQMEATFMANSPGTGSGIIPAPGALILHPYGRFSNANKFAGEIDTFECLEHARKHYRIDESRLVARGFSMGGAACWQFGVHYPTMWAACAPGAGFAETREFLKDFQKEAVKPTWYETKLWRMYDATEYAQNLFNLPTVAYSGEIDSQKQAADIMIRFAKKVGVEFPHIIGPKTGHSYEKGAKAEVNKLIDAIVEKGLPMGRKEVKFTTYTLRYNQCDWVTVTGLDKHWEKATVTGKRENDAFVVTTTGVASFAVTTTEPLPKGGVTVDGTAFPEPMWRGSNPDKHRTAHFTRVDGKWKAEKPKGDLRKAPGLQGPIDDAFMDSFVMVKPTGVPLSERTGKWAELEMSHAVKEWRRQFRGDAVVKADKEITDDDIKNSNLILWGDPKSNAVLAKIADRLPVKWTSKIAFVNDVRVVTPVLDLGGQTYDAGVHAPILIYPNPLNPAKYVVLNSGFTYREYAYLNNARQVPMLPDYAVVDVTTKPNSVYPGKVVRAGFFDEQWKLQADDGK